MLSETLVDGEFAARLVRAEVEPADFTSHPGGGRAGAVVPRESGYLFLGFSEFEHGDVDAALEVAPVRHEATYVQPSRHHNPIEPSATLAEWHDGEPTLVDAVQWVYGVRTVMAAVFGLPPERIRVRAPHTGGGFGCKGFIWPHQILAAATARIAGRPVRIALSRAQMIGGIVWGWGKATLEASHHDEHLGRWLSKDLAGVALPVNADIPADIDVAFVEEVDEVASPIGGKRIGELGATGVDAAVADAVFHATGRRNRELPITPDKLI